MTPHSPFLRKALQFQLVLFVLSITFGAWGQSTRTRIPELNVKGVQGSAGAGFTDFVVELPRSNFKIDRGTYVTAQVERGFEVLNLYFTMTLSQMTAEGSANYRYTNLSSSKTYSVDDVGFSASLLDLALGFKIKLIDGYWFRPYIEGGGTGGYYQLNYRTKTDALNAIGNDWKKTDVIMGSGYYGEGGIEVGFTDNFGIKFAGRFSDQTTKDLVTLDDAKIRYRAETYYLSVLMGF